MEELDRKILVIFTTVSHSFQRMTGRTNFFLARCVALMTAVSVSIDVSGYFMNILVRPTHLFMATLGIGMALSFLWKAYLCDLSEEDVSYGTRTKQRGLYNSRSWRLFMFVGAIIGLPRLLSEPLTAPYPLLEFLDASFLLLSFLFVYFIEVTPLPPCRGKVQEFFSSVFGVLQPVGQDS